MGQLQDDAKCLLNSQHLERAKYVSAFMCAKQLP